MTRRTALFAALTTFSTVCLVACGSGSGSGDTGAADMAQSPDLAQTGNPIVAPKNTWTFVPIEGAVCDDGSPTGIGVQLTDSPNLLVFFEGGGACWNYDFCVTLNTSTHGPFTQTEFDAKSPSFDRANAIFSNADGATFKGWNKVFVPYCTGDIHGGDAVQEYTKGADKVTVHHKGYSNARLALARLAATVRTPTNLVVTGSSAGGYGATINYSQIRGAYPSAKSYLIDDSGPIFVGDSLSGFLKMGWGPAWNLDATVFKVCPECKDGDWSLFYSALVKSFPNDRMALLTTEQDATIGGYLLTQPTDFKKYVYDLAMMRFDPTANFRYFIQTGKTHTMLFDEDKHTTGGVNVATWVNQMVTNDAAWKAVKP